MSDSVSELERWREMAHAIADQSVKRFTTPLHVICKEAVSTALFFDRHWSNQLDGDGNVMGRGLESVVSKDELRDPRKDNTRSGLGRPLCADTGGEILSLQQAAQQAQTKYLALSSSPRGRVDTSRALQLLGEIRATLKWHFTDGGRKKKTGALMPLKKLDADRARNPGTARNLAFRLRQYAGIAAKYRHEIDGLGGFDAKLIDEALDVAEALQSRSPGSRVATWERQQALLLRNKIVTLLLDRINTVRAAARFVFRNQPEIIREVTSGYERRRRAQARSTEKATSKKDPAGVVAERSD